MHSRLVVSAFLVLLVFLGCGKGKSTEEAAGDGCEYEAQPTPCKLMYVDRGDTVDGQMTIKAAYALNPATNDKVSFIEEHKVAEARADALEGHLNANTAPSCTVGKAPSATCPAARSNVPKFE